MSVRPSGDADDDATGDEYGDGNRAGTGDRNDEAAGDQSGGITGERNDDTVGGHALSRMIASVPWVVVLVGVAVLAVLLVVAVLSFRGPERPSAWAPGPPMSLPTAAAESVEAVPTARATTSTGPTATASVTPTGSPASSGSAAPPTAPALTGSPARPQASRSPSASTPAAPTDEGGAVTASYRVLDADDADHFEAQLVVSNGTSRSDGWQVELRFNGGVTGIRASSGPGVSVTIRGPGWYLLSGTGQLAAGTQQSVQLRFTRNGGEEYPTQCTINGTGCGTG
ncbi:hypothetical protein [Verrucosispora sp. WMMD573]|uniref:hypothetical protein n=1 Tax=Verrucosispora sp. WMMD573 TaxID=3015149 RepID=UPI00248C6EEA|nr:hypothetical protein [Verrucosispora sp. WMMD573]WBB54026.1 hypothetical protein O7601_26345 [Verrucosispora sp. WMMD573]